MKFLTNKLSLKQVAFFVAISTTVLSLLLIIGIDFFELNLLVSILLILATGIFFFFIVDSILQRHVFNRLRVIYKIIRSSKRGSGTNDSIVNDDELSIDLVNKEVVDWASNASKEISQLKDLESYRKDFVGNVSHELKTPIFNAQGFIHTLLDGGIYDEKINIKYLRNAGNNLDRLENIVNDLESISKLEAENNIVEYEDFDITALAVDVAEDLAFSTKKRKHKIEFGEGTDLPNMVRADKEMIRQVLVNLIMNSIKYSNKNGVSTINIYELDNQVLVEVSDQGIGIEERHLKHLFDRFYRVDSGRSRKEGGSGLGLSIVKHIIEAHDQTINVRSTISIGTTFGFTLEKK